MCFIIYNNPALLIADLTMCLVFSVILTNGSLTSSEHKPSKLAPYFTGLGLLSINSDVCNGNNFSFISFALEIRLLLFFASDAC